MIDEIEADRGDDAHRINTAIYGILLKDFITTAWPWMDDARDLLCHYNSCLQLAEILAKDDEYLATGGLTGLEISRLVADEFSHYGKHNRPFAKLIIARLEELSREPGISHRCEFSEGIPFLVKKTSHGKKLRRYLARPMGFDERK